MIIFVLTFLACTGPVPVDVVMVYNEIYFVLENEENIHAVWVAVHNPNVSARDKKIVWTLGHDMNTESWQASLRKTVREDRHFCLLSLFLCGAYYDIYRC